jgi:hypothetical protein
MSLAFSPTRYVISIRRKAKRERLLLPAMDDTIGQLDQPEFCQTFQRDNFASTLPGSPSPTRTRADRNAAISRYFPHLVWSSCLKIDHGSRILVPCL